MLGGGGGIRTPGTLSGSPVFKTGALNHSTTPPGVSVRGLTYSADQMRQVVDFCFADDRAEAEEPVLNCLGRLDLERGAQRCQEVRIAFFRLDHAIRSTSPSVATYFRPAPSSARLT